MDISNRSTRATKIIDKVYVILGGAVVVPIIYSLTINDFFKNITTFFHYMLNPPYHGVLSAFTGFLLLLCCGTLIFVYREHVDSALDGISLTGIDLEKRRYRYIVNQECATDILYSSPLILFAFLIITVLDLALIFTYASIAITIALIFHTCIRRKSKLDHSALLQ